MTFITQIFNTRELAIIVWVLFFIVILLLSKKSKRSDFSLISTFFKLYKWYVILVLYIGLIVFGLIKLSYWDTTMLKTTIYWTFGGAFVMFFNVDKAIEEDKYFWKVFIDCFKLTIIVEFLSNLYSFHIAIELFSIPVLILIGFSMALKSDTKENKIAKSFFGVIYGLYIIVVIIFSIVKISENYSEVFTVVNLKSLLFGSMMTIMFIPFLYFVALFMVYESFLKGKKYILQENSKLYQFLKWKIIKKCHLNLKRIRLVSNKLHIYTSIRKEQINDGLNLILSRNG
ncbi:MAG: hypothetical protein Q8J88_17625 [Bacteroidales bacterium]|nr:hypothetical protein [Bacteroidales bacterium]